MILHYDNAGPHTAKKVRDYLTENDIIRAPQTAYSPDIAPSDFYLFGHIKSELQGCSFSSMDELLSHVRVVLEGIKKHPLRSALNMGSTGFEPVTFRV